jgi:hypothetical protein
MSALTDGTERERTQACIGNACQASVGPRQNHVRHGVGEVEDLGHGPDPAFAPVLPVGAADATRVAAGGLSSSTELDGLRAATAALD